MGFEGVFGEVWGGCLVVEAWGNFWNSCVHAFSKFLEAGLSCLECGGIWKVVVSGLFRLLFVVTLDTADNYAAML